MLIRAVVFTGVLLCGAVAMGQSRGPHIEIPKNGPMATLVREANLYTSPSESAQRLSVILPGREMVIVGRSGNWMQVFANLDKRNSQDSNVPSMGGEQSSHPVSGWMLDKGVVDVNTVHGDQILFGEAASAEDAASEPNPPPRAAQEARLLYQRVVEMFPRSSLTPAAMWRAADIRWQLQKADASSLPSAHEQAPYLRQLMDENEMKDVEKYFPHTKFAAFAAYDMIDNKLCGDWQGAEKCPEKEAEYYARFADKYPDSIRAPEALYKASWRMAAAGDMWIADGNDDRAKQDRKDAAELAAHLEAKYPDSEYTDRVADLMFKVKSGIPVYGSSRE
ncbi:MAG TPA: outer membrane protein assembly factor BamD [Acidobacteriaceae bacterium]|nr:outer membrane protein assembly factor BamD [Acidobacteriaceae bacterium]